MVLVHKKSVAFLMRCADLAEAHAKALLEALDFAALENQLLVEALGRASGQWTEENTQTLDAFKRAFAQKYPGAPLTLAEIRNHQMRVTVEGIKRLPETPPEAV